MHDLNQLVQLAELVLRNDHIVICLELIHKVTSLGTLLVILVAEVRSELGIME